MAKIAFVGDPFSIEIFKAFGLDVFPAADSQEAGEVLRKLDMKEYAAVFVTEEVFEDGMLGDTGKDKKITVIPSLKSSEGIGYKLAERLIGQATGVREASGER